MKHFTNKKTGKLGKIERAKLINLLSSYKPANLSGAIFALKQTNKAVCGLAV